MFIRDSTLEIFSCSLWFHGHHQIPRCSNKCHEEVGMKSVIQRGFLAAITLFKLGVSCLWGCDFFLYFSCLKWSSGENRVKGVFQCHTILIPTNLPISLLSPGRPLGYSELYQMWQLRPNKVEVFNKCSFSWICTEWRWKIASPILKQFLSQVSVQFDVFS